MEHSGQNDVYVVLPSDTNAEIYPDNTRSDMRMRLPIPRVLDQRFPWEVGLMGLLTPRGVSEPPPSKFTWNMSSGADPLTSTFTGDHFKQVVSNMKESFTDMKATLSGLFNVGIKVIPKDESKFQISWRAKGIGEFERKAKQLKLKMDDNLKKYVDTPNAPFAFNIQQDPDLNFGFELLNDYKSNPKKWDTKLYVLPKGVKKGLRQLISTTDYDGESGARAFQQGTSISVMSKMELKQDQMLFEYTCETDATPHCVIVRLSLKLSRVLGYSNEKNKKEVKILLLNAKVNDTIKSTATNAHKICTLNKRLDWTYSYVPLFTTGDVSTSRVIISFKKDKLYNLDMNDDLAWEWEGVEEFRETPNFGINYWFDFQRGKERVRIEGTGADAGAILDSFKSNTTVAVQTDIENRLHATFKIKKRLPKGMETEWAIFGNHSWSKRQKIVQVYSFPLQQMLLNGKQIAFDVEEKDSQMWVEYALRNQSGTLDIRRTYLPKGIIWGWNHFMKKINQEMRDFSRRRRPIGMRISTVTFKPDVKRLEMEFVFTHIRASKLQKDENFEHFKLSAKLANKLGAHDTSTARAGKDFTVNFILRLDGPDQTADLTRAGDGTTAGGIMKRYVTGMNLKCYYSQETTGADAAVPTQVDFDLHLYVSLDYPDSNPNTLDLTGDKTYHRNWYKVGGRTKVEELDMTLVSQPKTGPDTHWMRVELPDLMKNPENPLRELERPPLPRQADGSFFNVTEVGSMMQMDMKHILYHPLHTGAQSLDVIRLQIRDGFQREPYPFEGEGKTLAHLHFRQAERDRESHFTEEVTVGTRNALPHTRQLHPSDTWNVSLVNVRMPITFFNVLPHEMKLSVEPKQKDKPNVHWVTAGRYSLEELVRYVELSLVTFGVAFRKMKLSLSKDLHVTLQYFGKEGQKVTFNKPLGDVLGFEGETSFDESGDQNYEEVSSLPGNVNRGYEVLWMYAEDLVHPIPIGNVMGGLLRFFEPSEARVSDNNWNFSFDVLQPVELMERRQLSEFKVTLHDHLGRELVFPDNEKPVRVTLLFEVGKGVRLG